MLGSPTALSRAIMRVEVITVDDDTNTTSDLETYSTPDESLGPHEGSPVTPLSKESAATVDIDGDRVTINQLVVGDPHVAEQVAMAGDKQEERARRVRLLLEGGARVATLGSNDIMLRRIQEALASATRQLAREQDAIGEMIRTARCEFEESLGQVFREQVGDDRKRGLLAQAFQASSERFFVELAGQLAAFENEFQEGRTDNLLGKLSMTFTACWQKAMAEFRQELASEGPDNPLQHVLKGQEQALGDLLRQMKALEETVTQRLIEIAEKVARETTRSEERRLSSAKGRDFEDILFDELWTLASPYGDIVVDVTNVTGANGKGGDYVISVAVDGEPESEVRVTWEAKNRENPMSFNAAVKALSEAMENRGASVGVLAFAHRDQMPGRDGPFMLLGEHMIACCSDMDSGDDSVLKVAYRLSRLLALSSSRAASTDSTAIRSIVSQINAALTALAAPRTHLREIRRRADEALAALGEADAAVNEAGQRLARMLTTDRKEVGCRNTPP